MPDIFNKLKANVSPELLESSKEYLKEQSESWTTAACLGKTVTLDGEDGPLPHTACHAWVGYTFAVHCFNKGMYNYMPWNQKYHKNAVDFLTLNVMSKRRSKTVCTPEAVTFLSRWLAHESPFSEYVINRDDEESLEHGHILYCGPNGLNLTEAMWMCKVSRFCTEGGQAADTFMTLVKGGVDGMLAVYVASLVRSYKGASFGYTGVEHHSTVIFPDNTSVLGYLKRDVNKTAGSTDALFGKSADKHTRASVATIRSFCKPFKKPDGWGGFVEGQGADRDTLVERVLEWQKELLGEKADKELALKKPTKDTVFLEMDM